MYENETTVEHYSIYPNKLTSEDVSIDQAN